MERLSHVAPWVPHVLYTPVIVGAVAIGISRSGVLATLGFFAGGVLLWTLVEYAIHRFIFHPPQWIEDDTRRIVDGLGSQQPVMPALPTWRHKFYFLVHGVHHDYPNDTTRLVMPPSVSIPLAVMFFFFFRSVMGLAAPGWFAGFVTGYLIYDSVHYLTHAGPMRLALARALKRRHFMHHYTDSTRNFGVSSSLWDIVLGTSARKQ